MTNSHDAGLVQLRTELVEEAEHALQTLLVVVDRLFQLMLLAVELVLVVAVNRLADLLDQAGSNTFTGFKINQLILIELEPELMTRTVFAIVGILHVLIDVPLARLSKL